MSVSFKIHSCLHSWDSNQWKNKSQSRVEKIHPYLMLSQTRLYTFGFDNMLILSVHFFFVCFSENLFKCLTGFKCFGDKWDSTALTVVLVSCLSMCNYYLYCFHWRLELMNILFHHAVFYKSSLPLVLRHIHILIYFS